MSAITSRSSLSPAISVKGDSEAANQQYPNQSNPPQVSHYPTENLHKFTTQRAAGPVESGKTAWLQFLTGHQKGLKFSVGSSPIMTIGSAPDNSIVIDDWTVSPQHAKIVKDGELLMRRLYQTFVSSCM